jgi:chromosome segregation ATPase
LGNEKNILKQLDKTCDEALNFLKSKDGEVKQKVDAVGEMKKNIDFADKNGFDKEPYTKVLKNLEESLYKSEMNEEDLMQEHFYMAKIMDGLRKATEKESASVLAKRDKLNFVSKTLKAQNNAYEQQIKSIDGETPEKEYLRSEIVKNEDYLAKNKEELLSYDGVHSIVIKGVDARQKKIDKAQKKRDALAEILTTKEAEHEEAFSNFTQSRTDFVDKKLELRSGAYTIPKEEVGKAELQVNDSGKFVAHLEDDIRNLRTQISTKDREISRYKDEIAFLDKQNALKDVDIETLEGKLKAWDNNYAEFHKLVDELAAYVGYPLNFSADGSVVGENPLIPLIQRVQNITRWLEENEELKAQEKEPSFVPYLIGGAAAMMLMMFKR